MAVYRVCQLAVRAPLTLLVADCPSCWDSSGAVFPAHRPPRRLGQHREAIDCIAPRAHRHGGTSAGAATGRTSWFVPRDGHGTRRGLAALLLAIGKMRFVHDPPRRS